jgi:hypothetical protein
MMVAEPWHIARNSKSYEQVCYNARLVLYALLILVAVAGFAA